MSEESSGEKVFPASPRKRQEARKKGQVAKSPELSGALVLLAMAIALHMALTSGVAYNEFQQAVHQAFAFNPHPDGMDLHTANLWQMKIAMAVLILVAPALLAALAVGMIANIAQVGLSFTPETMAPDFKRLNPMNAVKRIFSVHGTVDLAKGLLKTTLIAWICWSTLRDNMPLIASSLQLPFTSFLEQIGGVLWTLGLHVCFALAFIAVADYAYQRYDFEKNMKMTREEMKQEMKQSDGDPLIKQKIRQKQRAMAQKRMMDKVPTATVVVTNPTHFAVALKYEKGSRAPVVVARGQDLTALRIKEIAREHGVPTVENRPVARALYHEVRLGREIQASLYQAVAEILAFVYKTKKAA